MLFKFIYQHFTMGYSERQLIGILDVLKSIARKPNFFCLRFICSVWGDVENLDNPFSTSIQG